MQELATSSLAATSLPFSSDISSPSALHIDVKEGTLTELFTADRESKRLKRLLRNRVSAQQARERNKAYLGELEGRVKELEKKNSEVEERLSTLQKENQMLRQILKNTTAGRKK